MSSRTHPHAHTYIHPCTRTHVYAHAKEIFWHQICFTALPNRVQSSVTPFTSIIQSLYNSYSYWHHIGCAIYTNCHYLTSTVAHLPSIITHSQPLPSYPPLVCHSSLIHLISIHHLARIIFHPYLMSNPTHHPINMSVCYKPCQFSIY